MSVDSAHWIDYRTSVPMEFPRTEVCPFPEVARFALDPSTRAELTEENRRLREQIEVYAQVIHELAVERERRAMASNAGSNLRALPAHTASP